MFLRSFKKYFYLKKYFFYVKKLNMHEYAIEHLTPMLHSRIDWNKKYASVS